MSRNVQTWKIKRAPLHNEEPCRPKTLQTVKRSTFQKFFFFCLVLSYKRFDFLRFFSFLFCDPIRDPIRGPIRDPIRYQVGDPVRDPVRDPAGPILVLSTP